MVIRIISQDDENLCPPKQTGESCEDLCKEECHQCYKIVQLLVNKKIISNMQQLQLVH